MSSEIKGAEVLPDGLLLVLKDGREAILNTVDVLECAEKSGAFERAGSVLMDLENDWDADDQTLGLQGKPSYNRDLALSHLKTGT